MGQSFKSQLATSTGSKMLETIQLKHVGSEYIQELKKSISRVPFVHDYEIRFRFPGLLFNVKGTEYRRNYEKNNSGKVKVIQNPIKDISPNQRYNPEVVTYIEERLPLLTKNIDGMTQIVQTNPFSILNRDWRLPIKITYEPIKITFYDMYVQSAKGKYEWVSVSELFKVWIDNIFRCAEEGKNIDSYHTVLNYFQDFAIPQMDIIQFTRRLEMGDAKNYCITDKALDGVVNYFQHRYKNGLWDEYLNSTDQYLAKQLNDRQKDKLRGSSIAEKTIGLIDDIMTPIVNLLYTTAGIQNFVEKFILKDNQDMDTIKAEMAKAVNHSYHEYLRKYTEIAQNYTSTTNTKPVSRKDENIQNIQIDYSTEMLLIIEGLKKELNENGIDAIQKNAFKKYQEDAKKEGIPALLGSPELSQAIQWLAFASSAWSTYDTAKRLLAQLPVPVGNIGRITDKDWADSLDKGGLFKKPSAGDRAKAMAGDVLPGNLITTEFKDDSARAIIEYLVSLENNIIANPKTNSEFQDVFGLPLNRQAFKDLDKDGRFKNAKIMDESQVQDPWGNDPATAGINVIPIKTLRFYDIFPIAISYNGYDSDNTGEGSLTTFTVDFVFTHFEQK